MTAAPDEPSLLHDALALLGVSREEVDAAEQSGTLLALAAERFLLPGERQYDTTEVAIQCGVDGAALAKLWVALGFPQPSDEKVFTDQDVELLRTFLQSGSISEYSLHEVRVISASLGRIAEVFIDETWDAHRSAGQSEREALSEMGTVDLDRMERILMYLLRRHLVAGFYRRSALHDQAMRYGAPSMAVGFADLAGFSTLSQSLSGAELTRVLIAFEKASYDLVASLGGRVVKTLGDGVMFTADSAASGADAALLLASLGGAEGADADLPAVHVGLTWGPVLIRQGDCFGPTVNLVSRVVGCAAGGEVVVDAGVAERLADDTRLSVAPLGDHDLKSFGPVPLWRLARRTPATPHPTPLGDLGHHIAMTQLPHHRSAD